MRREQNLALVGALVSGAVIATGLVLLLVARVNPDAGARLRGVMLDIVTPVWSVVRWPFDGIAGAAGRVGDYVGAASRAEALEGQLAAARAELNRAAADRRALAQLKRLMAVREPTRRVVATARIVSGTSGSVVRSAMISAGLRDGVGPGLPVLSADGLIGRTVEAGNISARVLLLTDPASRVPVIVQRTGQAGLATGANRPALLLTDRLGQDLPLKAGDRVVTSGDGGVYPPGVPVGVIIDPNPEQPTIRPSATAIGAGFVSIEAPFLPLPAEATGPVYDAPVPVEARSKGQPAPRLREGVAPP